MLELFPDTARVEDGELTIGGVRASALAEEYGTPLVVYCEETVRAAERPRRRSSTARRRARTCR
jgi:diaminopimelate decarboxylase